MDRKLINQSPCEAEDQALINMDGTLREPPIDDYCGDIDFTPGSNG